ncbi:MAG: hypothetical protein II633_06685, partial [Bacteroidales bacterium]|nr:hypothetical protein [Bacteroidales bacterium]
MAAAKVPQQASTAQESLAVTASSIVVMLVVMIMFVVMLPKVLWGDDLLNHLYAIFVEILVYNRYAST